MTISAINFRQHVFHPFMEKPSNEQTIDLTDQKIYIASHIVFAAIAIRFFTLALGIQPGILLGLGMLGYSVVHFYGITAYMKFQHIKSFFILNLACREGDLDVVRSLLKKGYVNIEGNNGHQPLQIAAENQHPQIILELVMHACLLEDPSIITFLKRFVPSEVFVSVKNNIPIKYRTHL